jgi:hypothetical protein
LGVIVLKPEATSMLSLFCVPVCVVAQPTVNANRATTLIVLNEVRICFILFLVDDFDLSVSSVTRNRADQPIRPSACARQCPKRHIVPLAGVYANGTLVVLLLGSASRANTPQRNRDPNTF